MFSPGLKDSISSLPLPTGAATDTTLSEILPKATQFVKSGSIMYLGESNPGSLTSQPVWRIQKIDTTSGVIITFADGNRNFDNIWDNYLTLNYS